MYNLRDTIYVQLNILQYPIRKKDFDIYDPVKTFSFLKNLHETNIYVYVLRILVSS